MRKYFFTIMVFLIGMGLVIWPSAAFSADEVSFTEDTIINLSGSNINVYVLAGSLCDSMTVYDTYVSFTMSANSLITVKSNDKKILTNSLGIVSDCVDYGYTGYTQIIIPGQSTTKDVTVTPSNTTCSNYSGWGSGSGGGGSSSTNNVPETTSNAPTTTTGEVTATTTDGGKTTYTTSEIGTATIELSANAVASSTVIKISAEAKETIVVNDPVPSGKTILGNYIYNFTAFAGSTAVSTFSKDLTLTFTYTDGQVSGLNEDTLKVYYWSGSAWEALSGTIDKINNKIIATTNHFTYFVIMGEAGTTTGGMAKPSDYGLKEGDLIRAEGDLDVYIISQYGYKRLFLNPVIFNMYGHLGGWAAIKTVKPQVRDAFITSGLYRYVDSPKVYQLELTGEDTGKLHWLNITGESFITQGGKPESIFTINKSEYNWYPKGADKAAL